jgi:hypothetical protein
MVGRCDGFGEGGSDGLTEGLRDGEKEGIPSVVTNTLNPLREMRCGFPKEEKRTRRNTACLPKSDVGTGLLSSPGGDDDDGGDEDDDDADDDGDDDADDDGDDDAEEAVEEEVEAVKEEFSVGVVPLLLLLKGIHCMPFEQHSVKGSVTLTHSGVSRGCPKVKGEETACTWTTLAAHWFVDAISTPTPVK